MHDGHRRRRVSKQRALSPCCQPGCPTLTHTSYCAQHTKPDPRPNSTTRGYNHQWARYAKTWLRNHPNCNRCPNPATDVHHKDGRGPNGPHGYDSDNIEALCHPCHSRHTASNRRTA
jgi:5-methylcytosine-specific restriction protein A